MSEEELTWLQAVEPLLKRFRLPAMFDAEVKFGPKASTAMLELITEMAKRLDHAVEVVGRPDDYTNKNPYTRSPTDLDPA